jgi:hypothetical protein
VSQDGIPTGAKPTRGFNESGDFAVISRYARRVGRQPSQPKRVCLKDTVFCGLLFITTYHAGPGIYAAAQNMSVVSRHGSLAA